MYSSCFVRYGSCDRMWFCLDACYLILPLAVMPHCVQVPRYHVLNTTSQKTLYWEQLRLFTFAHIGHYNAWRDNITKHTSASIAKFFESLADIMMQEISTRCYLNEREMNCWCLQVTTPAQNPTPCRTSTSDCMSTVKANWPKHAVQLQGYVLVLWTCNKITDWTHVLWC